MIGHAYLWDPRFLVWGVTVVFRLLLSRASAESGGFRLSL